MTNTFNPDPLEFGNLIKNKREARGWSQSNLAQTALNNYDRKSAVSDIETGKKKLTTKDVRRFLTALESPQEEIDHWLGNTSSNTEQLQEQVSSLRDKNASLEDAIQRIETTNRDGLELLAHRFGLDIPENISEYDLRQLLTKQAEQFQRLKAEVETLRVKYPQLDNIVSAALSTLENGDTAAVRRLVRQAREILHDAHLLEGLEQDADLVHIDAQALIFDGNVQEAYEILSAAADSFASIDPLEPSRRRNTYGKILYDYGERFAGEASALAVKMLGKAVGDIDPELDAMLRASLENSLGAALQVLGERESSTLRLEQAVNAYHNALLEWTRGKVPLDWAMTQNNLGNALQTLGERESDTARLELAIDAYHNALQEWTQDKVPLKWAMTQNNLGNALRTLGERESGTERLEQAIYACHNALQERTRDKVPLQWATTQNNLGAALATLGKRECGTKRLEQAVNAYHNALLKWTRDKVPLDWATTQNNLGNALLTLGERESGTERLEQAIYACHNALQERTRDKVPLGWAGTQLNLCGVHLAYFSITKDGARLDKAEAHVLAALEVYEQAAPHYAKMAQALLQQIAELREDASR